MTNPSRDDSTLRAALSKRDPYAVFQKMPARGNPPDDWDTLLRQSRKPPTNQPLKRR